MRVGELVSQCVGLIISQFLPVLKDDLANFAIV